MFRDLIKTQKDYWDQVKELKNPEAELSNLKHMFPVSWDNDGSHNPLTDLPLE